MLGCTGTRELIYPPRAHLLVPTLPQALTGRVSRASFAAARSASRWRDDQAITAFDQALARDRLHAQACPIRHDVDCPGHRPWRSCSSLEVTNRPALSMVARTPERNHRRDRRRSPRGDQHRVPAAIVARSADVQRSGADDGGRRSRSSGISRRVSRAGEHQHGAVLLDARLIGARCAGRVKRAVQTGQRRLAVERDVHTDEKPHTGRMTRLRRRSVASA